jgi:hypothetical protein
MLFRTFAVYIKLYLGAMKSLQRLIEAADPDIDWVHILSQSHKVRGTDYELQVSRVSESGQFRIYISSAGQIHAHIFDPKHDRFCDSTSAAGKEIIQNLLASAIHDIDENKDGLFNPV